MTGRKKTKIMKYPTTKFRTKRFVFLVAATIALAALIGSGVLAAGPYANKSRIQVKD